MRIELTGSVRSVCPADGCGSHSVVTVMGFRGPHPGCVQLELVLPDDEARAFAAQYRMDKAVRIAIEVDEPDVPAGKGGA